MIRQLGKKVLIALEPFPGFPCKGELVEVGRIVVLKDNPTHWVHFWNGELIAYPVDGYAIRPSQEGAILFMNGQSCTLPVSEEELLRAMEELYK